MAGRRLLAPLALIVVTALLLACGRVEMTFHTDVKSPSTVEQSFSIRVEGELAKSMQSEFDPEELESEGWTVTQKEQGDAFMLTATKALDKESARKGLVPALTPGGAQEDAPTSSFDVREALLYREYRLAITIPAGPAPLAGAPSDGLQAGDSADDVDEGMQELGMAMLKEMFQVNWKATLPGEIVETNADRTEGGTAIWDLDVTNLQAGRELSIVSRETRPVSLQTEVKSPSEIVQTVLIRADSATAETLKSGPEARDLQVQGWDVSVKADGDSQLVVLTKSLDPASAVKNLLPMLAGPDAAAPAVTPSIQIKDSFFSREYHVKIAVPASGTGADSRGESASRPEWRLNLPGEVVESNADRRDGNVGIWYVDPRAAETPRDLVMVSREDKPLAPYIAAGIGLGGMLVIGGAILAVARRRSGQRPNVAMQP